MQVKGTLFTYVKLSLHVPKRSQKFKWVLNRSEQSPQLSTAFSWQTSHSVADSARGKARNGRSVLNKFSWVTSP